MNIIADQNIPYLPDQIGPPGVSLQRLPTEALNARSVMDADALLVRSATQVNRALLADSSVRFVGSATAGIDHLDLDYLQKAGIRYADAPGCNAQAVADYVAGCVVQLMQQGYFSPSQRKAGVIGVGRVGRAVVSTLERLGFALIQNDPPRAKKEENFLSAPLDQFDALDLICVHTPLTFTGPHPTHHLIQHDFLSRLKPGCVLLNAGRASVINTKDLKQAQHLVTILDVWEHEPHVDVALLHAAYIATPHIAGYSQLAKRRATQQLLYALCDHFDWESDRVELQSSPTDRSNEVLWVDGSSSGWQDAILQLDDFMALSQQWKQAVQAQEGQIASVFRAIRKAYRYRRELLLSF